MVAHGDMPRCVGIVKSFAQDLVVLDAGGEASVIKDDIAIGKSARYVIWFALSRLFTTFYDIEGDLIWEEERRDLMKCPT